jgi:hypothetical protein
MYMTPSSDGIVITTIARAHCDGIIETTAIGPGGDQGRAPAGEARDARDAYGTAGFGQGQGEQHHQPPTRSCPFLSRVRSRPLKSMALHLSGRRSVGGGVAA